MADVVDLSTLKKDPTQPQIDGLSPEDQEALARMAEENPEAAGERVTTAFLVVLKDGMWMASPDVSTPLILDREANTDDMRAASAKVVRDIDITDTAALVIDMQMQRAMAIQQQQHAAQLRSQLKL